MKRPSGRLLLCSALALVALAAVFAASAQAGSRELVNGFDNDYHCTSSADAADGVCKWFNAAIPWIRGGAPDPAKPVLVLDRDGTTDPDCASACNNADSAHSIELDTALSVAFPGIAKQLVDPRSPEFAALPLDVAHYSAMVVASNVNCGGCDLNNLVSQPDSEALKARAADILNFFRNGGGVMAMSGGETSGGIPAAVGRNAMTRGGSGTVAQCTNYYAFLPYPVTCSIYDGDVLTTPAGNGIGLTDDLYGFSHNSFEQPPAGSPLQVGAVLNTEVIDAASRGTTVIPPNTPQTLFTDVPLNPTIASVGSAATCTGSFSATDPGGLGPKAIHYKIGGVEKTVATDATGHASVAVPSGAGSVEFWGEDLAGNQEAAHHTLSVASCSTPKVAVAGVRRACVSKASLNVRISVNAPGVVKSVRITLDGKTLKTTSKSRFTLRINLKKLKAGRHRLRTVVTDQTGTSTTSTRTIARCAAAKPKRKAAPRFTG
jgi:hypothetical protein